MRHRNMWMALLILPAVSCFLMFVQASERPGSSEQKQESAPSKQLAAAADVADLIGYRIEDFTAKDFRGKVHSLSDYQDKRAVVVYFLGTECPLAKLYGPDGEAVREVRRGWHRVSWR